MAYINSEGLTFKNKTLAMLHLIDNCPDMVYRADVETFIERYGRAEATRLLDNPFAIYILNKNGFYWVTKSGYKTVKN
jgi:hypothetical protein